MNLPEKYISLLAPLMDATTQAEFNAAILTHYSNRELYHKVRIKNDSGDVEGVWATFLDTEDKSNYLKDDYVTAYVAILLNEPLMQEDFVYGAPIYCMCNGSERPEALSGEQGILVIYTDHVRSLTCT